MGFNAGLAGIRGSEKMVSEMMHSESEQILAMASFMRATGTHAALQRRDWTDFARRYNGAGFATNRSRPSTSLRPSLPEGRRGSVFRSRSGCGSGWHASAKP